MARGKNAPALFEVIRNAQEKQRQQDQRLRQQSDAQQAVRATPAAAQSEPTGTASTSTASTAAASLLKSPLFWFKGRSAHEEVAGKIARPTAPVKREFRSPDIQSSPAERPLAGTAGPIPIDASDEASVHVSAPPAPAYRPAVAEYARQVRQEIAAQETPAAEQFFAKPTYPASLGSMKSAASASLIEDDHAADHRNGDFRSGKPEISIDRDRRQISLRLSYNAAIIAAFAVVVACGLAFLIGSAGKAKSTSVAESAPQPGVMDVPTEKRGVIANTQQLPSHSDTPLRGGTGSGDDVRANAVTDHSQTGIDTGGQPIPLPTNVKRVVGLQYVVVFSSPSQQEVDTFVKFLADNGVAATGERALPGYSAAWYSVVGTKSFEHISKNPQYDVYIANLIKLSKKYSQQTQKFVGGKPAAYTWKLMK